MTVPGARARSRRCKARDFFPPVASRRIASAIHELAKTSCFLTGTAEVGLTAYHMDEILDEADLPKIRRHQHLLPPRSRHLRQRHRRPLSRASVRQVRAGRHLPQRRRGIEAMAPGDARLQRRIAAAAEAAVPRDPMLHRRHRREERRDVSTSKPGCPAAVDGNARRGYGETHSASRLYEFQARRLNLRYKDADGKTRFCHTLNNTVVASPRILIPILENYQNADGSVTVPDVAAAVYGRAGADRSEVSVPRRQVRCSKSLAVSRNCVPTLPTKALGPAKPQATSARNVLTRLTG